MVVEECRKFIQSKNITMLFDPKENEVVMDVVPDYLTKIVRNLIVNAMKFTDENGDVSITSQISSNKLKIIVPDDGMASIPNIRSTKRACSVFLILRHGMPI